MPPSDYIPAPFSASGDPPGAPLWSFTKFRKAEYEVALDLEPIESDPVRGTAVVKATLEFDVASTAPVLPVIEFTSSLASNIAVELNGRPVGYRRVAPAGDTEGTSFFGIEGVVSDAENPSTLIVRFETELRVQAGPDDDSCFMRPSDPGVYWHFRMCDERPRVGHGVADDSNFLGRYLPTNLEFDAHPRLVKLTFSEIGRSSQYLDLFTNGVFQGRQGLPARIGPNTQHEISFPSSFPSSSVFFYLGHPGFIKQHPIAVPLSRTLVHGTAQAQNLKVTVFGNHRRVGKGGYKWDPANYDADVRRAAESLYEDFGEFKHENLLLLAGRQGMEYAGAAEVAGGNVLHEMFHLFVGRYLLPVDGASGWWDEALAHWYVSGKNAYAQPPDTPAAIGSGPKHRRWTSHEARTIGAMLIGHLHYLLQTGTPPHAGGMIDFLAELLRRPVPVQMDTDKFRSELEAFADPAGNISFKPLFDRYVRR